METGHLPQERLCRDCRWFGGKRFPAWLDGVFATSARFAPCRHISAVREADPPHIDLRYDLVDGTKKRQKTEHYGCAVWRMPNTDGRMGRCGPEARYWEARKP